MWRAIISKVEGFLKKCGGCSVMWRDITSNVEDCLSEVWKVRSNVEGYLEAMWRAIISNVKGAE